MDNDEKSTPTQVASPELVAAAVEMIKAKIRLWDASVVVEGLIGFDVDTNGGTLDAHCAVIDEVEDVSDRAALELIAELREAGPGGV